MACSSGESSAMRLAGGNRKTIAFPYDRSTWLAPPQNRQAPAAPTLKRFHNGWSPKRGTTAETLQARTWGRTLGASAPAHRQVAYLVQEHRTLQRIHL